jgi:hypothetical protein
MWKEGVMSFRTLFTLFGLALLLTITACGENVSTAQPSPTPTSTDVPASPMPTETETSAALNSIVDMPESFDIYNSTAFTEGTRHKVTNFSVHIPEDWISGWLIDSGITAFTIESYARAWQDPESVWIMIVPMAVVEKDGLLEYIDEFGLGSILDEPAQQNLTRNQALVTKVTDGETLKIAATIWADDPNNAVFAVGYMPANKVEKYRSYVESILFSIDVGEPNRVPDVMVLPRSGPIPTSYNFYMVDFLPNEIIAIEVYQPDGSLVYQKTISADAKGNSTLTITSEASDPPGTYRFVARGNEGSSASVQVVVD